MPNSKLVIWICVMMLNGISNIIELKFLANGANYGALFFSSSTTKTVLLAIVKGWVMIINEVTWLALTIVGFARGGEKDPEQREGEWLQAPVQTNQRDPLQTGAAAFHALTGHVLGITAHLRKHIGVRLLWLNRVSIFLVCKSAPHIFWICMIMYKSALLLLMLVCLESRDSYHRYRQLLNAC